MTPLLATPDEELFEDHLRNLRLAATIVEWRDRPDKHDIADACRWAASMLRHYREQDAAAATGPTRRAG